MMKTDEQVLNDFMEKEELSDQEAAVKRTFSDTIEKFEKKAEEIREINSQIEELSTNKEKLVNEYYSLSDQAKGIIKVIVSINKEVDIEKE